MSLDKRLERLEVLVGGKAETPPAKLSRVMERYFHVHENARREIQGLEPLPDLPYTEEDRADDRVFLEEVIPKYRASPGWRSGEGKAILDAWEQDARERLAKGAD